MIPRTIVLQLRRHDHQPLKISTKGKNLTLEFLLLGGLELEVAQTKGKEVLDLLLQTYPMQLKLLFERSGTDEPVSRVSVLIEQLLFGDCHKCQAPRLSTAGIRLDLNSLGLD